MDEGHMPLAVDGRGRPIEIGTFRWSSAGSPWAGFPMESHTLGPHGKLAEFGIKHALVGLCANGIGEMKVATGHGTSRVTSSPGRFTLLSEGYEQKPITWSGTREILFVALGAREVGRYMRHERDLAYRSLAPQYAIPDGQVANLILNMRAEVRAGCPGGQLYAESLSIALATYLLGRYSGRPLPNNERRQSLSSAQVRRVNDYIEANLASDIGVVELADLVGLSAHYFSSLFKTAFGASPHRYVLRRRIEEAQRLLEAGTMPIAQLALHLGFSDQSHFSETFRKATGTTPKRYRNAY